MGEPTAKLVFLIQSPKRTARLNLDGPFFVVGRGEPFPVFHDDPTLSREHATIVDTGGGGYAVKDLGSRNGVTINGDRIDRYGEVPFREGDLLQAGATTIRLVQVAELEARRAEAGEEEQADEEPMTVDEAGLTGQHPAVQQVATDAFRGEETGLIDPTGSFDGTATEMALEEDDEGELSISDDAPLAFPDGAEMEETLEMDGPPAGAVDELLAREEPLTAEELVDLGELAAEIEDVIPTQMGVEVPPADEATVEMDPPPGAIDALDEDGETTLGLEPPEALLE